MQLGQTPRFPLRRRRQRSYDRAWLAVCAVVTAAMMVSTLVVLTDSRAAFTATTSNQGSNITAGTVTLTDDDAAAAMFNLPAMKPGDSSTHCITVTYNGTIATPTGVKLYTGGLTDSGVLAQYLDVVVDEGTGGNFAGCAGFSGSSIFTGTLDNFNTTKLAYGSGVGGWTPSAAPESRTFRFTVTLNAATPDSQQGKAVSALKFIWEVQS